MNSILAVLVILVLEEGEERVFFLELGKPLVVLASNGDEAGIIRVGVLGQSDFQDLIRGRLVDELDNRANIGLGFGLPGLDPEFKLVEFDETANKLLMPALFLRLLERIATDGFEIQDHF